jgi:hypothetical protein
LAFVNLSPTGPSLVEALGEITAGASHLEFSRLRRAARRADSANANWKVCVSHHLERRRGAGASPAQVGAAVASYWLFPTLLLNFASGQLWISHILPLSHDQTRTTTEWYVAPAGQPDMGQDRPAALSDEVQRETIASCEAEWRQWLTEADDRGGVSPGRAHGASQFHDLVAMYLGEQG